jgi:hypothetical protein
VIRAVSAPTVNSETAAIKPVATTAAVPLVKKNGINGSSAPSANIRNEETAAPHGDPRPSLGSMPSSSRAWVSSATFGSRISSVATRSARSAGIPLSR